MRFKSFLFSADAFKFKQLDNESISLDFDEEGFNILTYLYHLNTFNFSLNLLNRCPSLQLCHNVEPNGPTQPLRWRFRNSRWNSLKLHDSHFLAYRRQSSLQLFTEEDLLKLKLEFVKCKGIYRCGYSGDRIAQDERDWLQIAGRPQSKRSRKAYKLKKKGGRVESGDHLLLSVVPMAGPVYEAKTVDCHDIMKIFEAEGVEFLLSCDGKVPLSSCNGKTVCLFFSANWCRPCKTFMPRLVELYDTLKKKGKSLEIIFVSFDRDEDGFEEHFKSMPWLAVPFDAHLHRRLIDRYQVVRIPSFIPLCSDGITVEEDMIGCIEDYGAEAFPFTNKRREELKAMDQRKREIANLEELLAHEGRNFLISGDDRKVPVSELAHKTVGLYFCAYWSPPCRAFTAQLTDVYNNLNSSKDHCFEVVLVSTDKDLKEFNVNRGSMPWLAIPYMDRTRHDLCRIFDIKGIPALVLIGPEGKVISTNGRLVVSSYGAEAFPFTDSRIRDLESALRKEGEALPQQVEDVKHEHVLKLDMAKAYVCDFCKKQGKFWTFSCDVCDYDLHPSCVEKVSREESF